MAMPRNQNAGKYHNLLIVTKSVESVVTLKYLAITVTNRNDIHEKIRNRLNSGILIPFCLASSLPVSCVGT